MSETKSGARRVRRVLLILLAALLLAAAGIWIYLSDYYRADATAAMALEASSRDIEIRVGDRRVDFVPREAEAGLIFYPGGKVEYTAYAPLMRACAERGILCVLLRMPGNLAVLDTDAAEGIAENYPDVDRWYIGGHSLGGTCAAIHVSSHKADYAGLILLGAYSTRDLSGTALDVLSVYGSEDGVLNREKYEACRKNLPDDAVEVVISGGCHALFGCYGAQSGDGTPTITSEEQIKQTADAISGLIEPNAADAAA